MPAKLIASGEIVTPQFLATMTTISISLLTFRTVRSKDIFCRREPSKMIFLSCLLFACASVKVNAFQFIEEKNDFDDPNLFDTREVKRMYDI